MLCSASGTCGSKSVDSLGPKQGIRLELAGVESHGFSRGGRRMGWV
jgi:hypothetical protein